MKRLPRTGWLLAGVASPESVADHSFGTAVLTCLLAEMINSEADGSPETYVVDVGRAARIALVHDLAECVVTDLPREAGEYIGRKAKHAAEADAMADLLADIAGGDSFVQLWREYESGTSREALLVRDADKLEMVYQARAYAAAGNRNLDEFWQGHEWTFQVSRQLFEQLLSEEAE